MTVLRRWHRARRDPQALQKLLAEPPPPGAADIPLEVRFGWGGAWGYLAQAIVFVVMLVGYHLLIGIGLDLFLVFFFAAHLLLLLAHSVPDFTTLNLALNVSAEGVRIRKVHRSYVIPWWEASAVYAAPDLLRMKVIGRSERITVETASLGPDVRESLAQALRARALEHQIPFDEWPKRGQLLARFVPGAARAGGVIVFMLGFIFFLPGGTLGMRCSANSAFLQQTFGTPTHHGCVVLRVSAGAQSAGIRRGDLVIEMDGVPVTSGQQFQHLFDKSHKASWDFVVLRQGEPEPLTFHVKGGRGRDFPEDPSDPFFYYLRGRWDAADDPDSAMRDYSRVIELEPRFDLAYLYRGQLYEDRGNRVAAGRDYLKALELSPNLAEAHAIYAYFIVDDDTLAANEHIRKAIELDRCQGAFESDNIDCSSNYLLLAALLGFADPSEAARTAEQGIRFYDGYAGNYFNAMCSYAITGNRALAQEYAQRYLDFPDGDRTKERTQIAEAVRDGTGRCS